jgi:CHAT domain-containing protein
MLETLAKRGLEAQELPADPHALLDAVADAQFDVLHLATHAAADLDDISSSSIVLSERGGKATAVAVRTLGGAVERRWTRRPLVFLNACQTGRQSPALSDWGGWSKTFWDAGAGAFVGTSWSVREGPAAKFARGFYEGLLAGKPLVEAAVQARERAGQLDASWLAFTVWGRPAAAMQPAPDTG